MDIQILETKIASLKKLVCGLKLTKSVELTTDKSQSSLIEKLALSLKPWRKGPFKIDDLFIDIEWQSFIKFDILEPFTCNTEDKIVTDVGCNNGYYMFRMLEFSPKQVIGSDPSLKYHLQFKLINALAKTNIEFELLGVEDLPNYAIKFDVIFCSGMIYHKGDPIKMLRGLKKALKLGGIVFLDTMYIESDEEIALVPQNTYSKIPNMYFVPSTKTLKSWCLRAGSRNFGVLAAKKTDKEEQRKVAWIDSYSLENFLDPENENLTCEGCEALKRVYVHLRV